MIDLKILDGMKLVPDENVATPQQASDILERAIAQGSQGWGVRQDEAVILRLGLELRKAQALAGDTTDTKNALKGLQLENGRLKKRLLVVDGIQTLLDRATARETELLLANDVLENTIAGLRVQLDGAYASNAAEADGEYKVDAS